jgi:SulP family sulfate permease
LGGLPVASSLERGLLNLKSGGKTPLSGIIAAILLFLVLVALMPFFALIPLPTVAAILLVAVLRAWNIKQWKKLLKNATQTEGLLFFVTLLLTVILGTALAAVAGTILSLVLSKSQAVKDRGQESFENPSKNP